MTPTQRRSFKKSENDFSDNGILVKDAMKLIERSEFYDEIIQTFNLDEIQADFIEIKGAKKLVDTLIDADEEFDKIDLDSSLENVRLHKYTDDNQIILEISDIQENTILTKTKKDIIHPQSIYSVRSEYLGMYGIDKYLEYCKSQGYQDIIDANIELLNIKATQCQTKKKFRLLKKNDEYFVRAITSTDVYKDYNLRFSLFVTLIELHKLTKYKGHSFYVDRFNLSESDLTALFKSSRKETVTKDTEIGFAFELVNDEIRRDAVKLNGLFTVYMAGNEILVKSEDPKKCKLLSLPHRNGLDFVKAQMGCLNTLFNDFIDSTINDAKQIKVLGSPDLFREYVLMKIQNSKNSDFNKNYREQTKLILSNKVKTIFELATLFKKVELLIEDEHIVSLDFWRHKLYQVLMDGVKSHS